MNILLILLFAIYPFGQLPGILLSSILGTSFRLHPIDFITFFILIYTISASYSIEKVWRYRYFFVPIIFSFFVAFFEGRFTYVGLLYFFRILSYALVLIYAIHNGLKIQKHRILQTLLLVGVLTASLGWIQYLLFPDLTTLKYYGWDDHYYRLTGAFLDPAFTGIVLVLSSFVCTHLYIKSAKLRFLFIELFLLVSLGFTYSRASILAYLVGKYLMLRSKSKKLFVVVSLATIMLVVMLPKNMGGEGVNLSRTNSINQKLVNYRQNIEVIVSSPLFGVGMNNVCEAKKNTSGENAPSKNSCNGFDNSILFFWATSGVLGLLGLCFFIYRVKRIAPGNESSLLTASFVSILIHSMFTNTLFYPWVIVWMIGLLSKNSPRIK